LLAGRQGLNVSSQASQATLPELLDELNQPGSGAHRGNFWIAWWSRSFLPWIAPTLAATISRRTRLSTTP